MGRLGGARQVKPFPWPETRFDAGAVLAAAAFNLLLVFAFLAPTRAAVAAVVREKELRLREGMRIFGLQARRRAARASRLAPADRASQQPAWRHHTVPRLIPAPQRLERPRQPLELHLGGALEPVSAEGGRSRDSRRRSICCRALSASDVSYACYKC